MKEIKVDMFALCQGAHEMNGHLTVVNTMDDFAVPSLPARISFGLAIKLYIKEFVEGDKVMNISIMDKESGKSIIPPIRTNLHIKKLDKASHIKMALNLQNVLFIHSGAYDVHLELDGKRLDDFVFYVISDNEN